MSDSAMDHSQHQMYGGGDKKRSRSSNPSDFSAGPVHHAKTEFGPHVDMRAAAP
jgi:hypothetical protein